MTITHGELDYRDDLEGWVFTGEAPGPAGVASLILDDLRLSVDAVEPARLVELAVFDGGDDSTPGVDTLDLVRALLGGEASARLTARTAGPTRIDTGPAYTSAVRLALVQLIASIPAAGSHLTALEAAFHAHRLPGPSAATLAADQAWAALPRAIALAMACLDQQHLLGGVVTRTREALRDRVVVLLAIFDDPRTGWRDDLLPRRTPPMTRADLLAPLHDLVALLGDTAPDAPLSRATVDESPAAGGVQERPRRPLAVVPGQDGVRIDQHRPVAAYRARLGRSAAHVRPGTVRVEGWAPGELRVTLPVGLDVTAEDLRGVVARLTDRAGTVLGTSRFVVGPLDADGVLATAAVRVDRRGLVSDDILLDVAVEGLRPLDRTEAARLDQLVAVRAGQRAVAAGAYGRRHAAADAWDECAQRHAVASDGARAAARTLATAARAGAWPSADGAVLEWVGDLVGRWNRWAAEIRAALPSDVHRAAAVLRAAIRDVTAVVGESHELTELHEALACRLTDDPAEQEEHYALATALHYRAGRFADAARCLAAAHGRATQTPPTEGSIRKVFFGPVAAMAASSNAVPRTSVPDRLEVTLTSADDRVATVIVKTGRGASDVTVRLKGAAPLGGLRTRDGDEITPATEVRIASDDRPVEELLRSVLWFG